MLLQQSHNQFEEQQLMEMALKESANAIDEQQFEREQLQQLAE